MQKQTFINYTTVNRTIVITQHFANQFDFIVLSGCYRVVRDIFSVGYHEITVYWCKGNLNLAKKMRIILKQSQLKCSTERDCERKRPVGLCAPHVHL